MQLVRPQIGGRQWSWQLRWRAFGCTERRRSSRQHRSSHGAALVVFVCLRVLVTCARVVEFGVRRHASGSLQPVWSGSSHLNTLYCQTRPITLLLCSGTSELYAHIRMDRHIFTFDEMCAEAVQGSRTIELAYTRLHMSIVSSGYDL